MARSSSLLGHLEATDEARTQQTPPSIRHKRRKVLPEGRKTIEWMLRRLAAMMAPPVRRSVSFPNLFHHLNLDSANRVQRFTEPSLSDGTRSAVSRFRLLDEIPLEGSRFERQLQAESNCWFVARSQRWRHSPVRRTVFQLRIISLSATDTWFLRARSKQCHGRPINLWVWTTLLLAIVLSQREPIDRLFRLPPPSWGNTKRSAFDLANGTVCPSNNCEFSISSRLIGRENSLMNSWLGGRK